MSVGPSTKENTITRARDELSWLNNIVYIPVFSESPPLENRDRFNGFPLRLTGAIIRIDFARYLLYSRVWTLYGDDVDEAGPKVLCIIIIITIGIHSNIWTSHLGHASFVGKVIFQENSAIWLNRTARNRFSNASTIN